MKTLMKYRYPNQLLIVLSVLFCLSAVNTTAVRAQKQINVGVAKRSAKLYVSQRLRDKAIERLQECAEAKPDDAEVHFLLGALYAEKGMIEEMNRSFATCLDLKKGKKYLKKGVKVGNASAFVRQGINYSKQEMWWRFMDRGAAAFNARDHKTSTRYFQLAISIIPDSSVAYKNLSDTYTQMEDYEGAIGALRSAIQYDSTSAMAYMNLGIAIINHGEPAEAVPYIEKADQLRPGNLSVLKNLAIAYQRSGNREGALETAEKALEIDPEEVGVVNMAGEIYLRQENYEKAAKFLEMVTERKPELIDAVFNLAAAYKGMGQEAKAEGLFTRNVEANPEDSEAWYQLGLIYNRNKSFDKAISAFQKVVDLQPKDVQAWKALYKVYARKSNMIEGGEAAKYVRKAKEALSMVQTLEGQ